MASTSITPNGKEEDRTKQHGHITPQFKGKVIMVGVSVIMTLLLLEIGIRVFTPSQFGLPNDTLGYRPSANPVLGYEPIPNSTFFSVYDGDPYNALPPDGKVEYHINAWGMRESDRRLLTGEGAVRVLVLGDSFSFGIGVTYEDTYSTRLETLLQGSAQEGERFQVLNAAVQGYSTREEIEQLTWLGPRMRPHIIVLGYMLNDIYYRGRIRASPRCALHVGY